MARKTGKCNLPGGVWSAIPTPLTARMELDVDSIKRMMKHHARLGVKGLFVAGTNGEGPWITMQQRRTLIRTIVRNNPLKMPVAVQVTDNSAARILENAHAAKEDGADIAVIAPPYFLVNATPTTVLHLYQDAIRRSPLPVGIYDRGSTPAVPVTESILHELYSEKNVVLIKDSSANFDRMKVALEAKRRRPRLTLLCGWEFNTIPYLKAGYDGLLLGGGVFNGHYANLIMNAVAEGDIKKAELLQARLNRLMYGVYGGKKIKCWLSGEKYLLMRLGIFRSWKNYPDYPLTPACRRAVEYFFRKESKFLLP